MRQQNKLLGHVIRADMLDPMRLPTIDSNLNTPGVFTRRTGKPRLHWVKENCKWVYKLSNMFWRRTGRTIKYKRQFVYKKLCRQPWKTVSNGALQL